MKTIKAILFAAISITASTPASACYGGFFGLQPYCGYANPAIFNPQFFPLLNLFQSQVNSIMFTSFGQTGSQGQFFAGQSLVQDTIEWFRRFQLTGQI